MTFRCLAIAMAGLILAAAAGARAADCVEAREGYDAEGRHAVHLMPLVGRCGSLKVVERRSPVPGRQADFLATYPVFDPPRGDAERRYNEWAAQQAQAAGPDSGDAMTGVLYLSARLLSARAGGWRCCGAVGGRPGTSLNLDARTGIDLRLGDLVDVARVAELCRRVFSQLEAPIPGQGMLFEQSYPRGRFEKRVDDAVWSVNAEGLRLEFGALLGFVGAEFTCDIPTDELRQVAKPGIPIPF